MSWLSIDYWLQSQRAICISLKYFGDFKHRFLWNTVPTFTYLEYTCHLAGLNETRLLPPPGASPGSWWRNAEWTIFSLGCTVPLQTSSLTAYSSFPHNYIFIFPISLVTNKQHMNFSRWFFYHYIWELRHTHPSALQCDEATGIVFLWAVPPAWALLYSLHASQLFFSASVPALAI